MRWNMFHQCRTRRRTELRKPFAARSRSSSKWTATSVELLGGEIEPFASFVGLARVLPTRQLAKQTQILLTESMLDL